MSFATTVGIVGFVVLFFRQLWLLLARRTRLAGGRQNDESRLQHVPQESRAEAVQYYRPSQRATAVVSQTSSTSHGAARLPSQSRLERRPTLAAKAFGEDDGWHVGPHPVAPLRELPSRIAASTIALAEDWLASAWQSLAHASDVQVDAARGSEWDYVNRSQATQVQSASGLVVAELLCGTQRVPLYLPSDDNLALTHEQDATSAPRADPLLRENSTAQGRPSAVAKLPKELSNAVPPFAMPQQHVAEPLVVLGTKATTDVDANLESTLKASLRWVQRRRPLRVTTASNRAREQLGDTVNGHENDARRRMSIVQVALGRPSVGT